MYASDEILIDALIRQEDPAYRFAVKQYQGPMYYLARSIAGDKIADEIVQEAWFSILKSLSKFRRQSSLKTWIFTIVANEAKSRLRKEKRVISLESLTNNDPEVSMRFDDTGHWSKALPKWHADSPEALLSSEELEQCLNHSINTLPSLQGATLNLKERQGHSLAEICNILDVSESNVRVLLHRARHKLFRVIEHFQITGECCSD